MPFNFGLARNLQSGFGPEEIREEVEKAKKNKISVIAMSLVNLSHRPDIRDKIPSKGVLLGLWNASRVRIQLGYREP